MTAGRLAADAGLLQTAVTAFGPASQGRVGVAVSGGGDSLALLHLIAAVAPKMGWVVHSVTVDHRLRPEAAAEAVEVGKISAALGVAHDVLRWDHGQIAGNLQDQARRARYRLMADWARVRGIGQIAVGHTADDQAETFLMGLARGAGLDGLAGMRPVWTEGGIEWRRPLLIHKRADLQAYLTRHGLDWTEDPSNTDDRFARVKARRALKALKPLGITVERLAGVVQNLADARHAVVNAVAEAAATIVQERAGECILSRPELIRLGPEVRRRLLIAALRWVSSAQYAPRADAVRRLEQSILQGKDATLWGCRIRVSLSKVRIVREPKAVVAVCGSDQLWDGRWRLDGPHDAGFEVRALGAGGLVLCQNWRQTAASRDALVVSPAIWHGDRLISAPLAGLDAGWTARIVAGFSQFVVSH